MINKIKNSFRRMGRTVLTIRTIVKEKRDTYKKNTKERAIRKEGFNCPYCNAFFDSILKKKI